MCLASGKRPQGTRTKVLVAIGVPHPIDLLVAAWSQSLVGLEVVGLFMGSGDVGIKDLLILLHDFAPRDLAVESLLFFSGDGL